MYYIDGGKKCTMTFVSAKVTYK